MTLCEIIEYITHILYARSLIHNKSVPIAKMGVKHLLPQFLYGVLLIQ